jgi:hypothetical protein
MRRAGRSERGSPLRPPGLERWLTALVASGLLLVGCTGEHRGTSHVDTGRAPLPGVSRGMNTGAGKGLSPAPAATSPGPDGMRAAWVQRENARPGTVGWRITTRASRAISGFADEVYAAEGQRVSLYVSTQARAFHVEAYRMGYYGGTGARLVWRSPDQRGRVQRPCPRTPTTNMVSCAHWRSSLALTLSEDFVPGDYLFKLVGSGGEQSYIPLTMWDPASRATYLIKNDVFTWQAWNSYGGYDFYAGRGDCPPSVYPLCSRARVVSFDRPYAENGAHEFLSLELPLLEFMEEQGLDVSYATDLTVVQHPSLLLRHKTLLSLGHDECWELRERRAAVAAERRGLNIAFFAASAMLRHVRLQSSRLGPGREVVDYRDSGEDPLNGHGNPLDVTGNTWASPPASWPEDNFVGESYVGYREPDARPVPFVVADAGAWIFAGTHAHNGTIVPGVIASDVDGFNPNAHPANLQILGHSPVPLADSQASVHWGPIYYSDMTFYTDPTSNAGIFDSGTNTWISALGQACPSGKTACPATFVRRVTGNLLRRLGLGPAGATGRSHSNWQHVHPY